MRERILLIGAGGHAASCIDVIETADRLTIAGLVGLPAERDGSLLGYRVLGTDEDLATLLPSPPNVLVTIGHIRTPVPRIGAFERAESLGCRFPTVVSPRAHVSRHAEIGEGTIVMHGAVVNAGARIGRNCIINSLALVEHGVEIADHVHVSTSAAINSGVRVGRGTFIGSNSAVKQCTTIGEMCLIGMGQMILRDCADGERVSGRKAGR